jgi:hypothetical protein
VKDRARRDNFRCSAGFQIDRCDYKRACRGARVATRVRGEPHALSPKLWGALEFTPGLACPAPNMRGLGEARRDEVRQVLGGPQWVKRH